MKMARPTFGLIAVFAAATALAQSDDVGARKVIVSIQTGTPMPSAHHSTDSNRPSPVARSATGNELVAVTVLDVAPTAASAPRQRRIDYSEDKIVIVGIAADGVERTRTVMVDPRLIRAEAILGEDDLTTDRFYRHSVDFPLIVDDPDVVSVRILKPRWTGKEWDFDIIAETLLQ